MTALIQNRRDTAANWTAANPVLPAGVLGVETDHPEHVKVGDGSTAWNALPYIGIDTTAEAERIRDVIGAAVVSGTGVSVVVDDGADTITYAVDTVTEAERIRDVIGAAIAAGSNVTVTVNDGADTITIASSGGGGGGGGHLMYYTQRGTDFTDSTNGAYTTITSFSLSITPPADGILSVKAPIRCKANNTGHLYFKLRISPAADTGPTYYGYSFENHEGNRLITAPLMGDWDVAPSTTYTIDTQFWAGSGLFTMDHNESYLSAVFHPK